MGNTYLQDGDTLEWANATGSPVSSGDVVVVGCMTGVAMADIADGESGSVMVTGVHSPLPKTAGTAWSQGDRLDYDVSAAEFTKGLTPATGDVTGCAVAAADAASADATAEVKLTPGTGTVN